MCVCFFPFWFKLYFNIFLLLFLFIQRTMMLIKMQFCCQKKIIGKENYEKYFSLL